MKSDRMFVEDVDKNRKISGRLPLVTCLLIRLEYVSETKVSTLN